MNHSTPHTHTGDIAQWLDGRNSNPKTLGSIHWRDRVRDRCCFSFLPLLAQSPAYFPEISLNFFFSRDRLFWGGIALGFFWFCFFSEWEISWAVVSVACYLMALVLAIYIFRHVSFLIF